MLGFVSVTVDARYYPGHLRFRTVRATFTAYGSWVVSPYLGVQRVYLLMAALVNCYEILWLPIVVVSIGVMEVYILVPHEFQSTMTTGMVLPFQCF